MSPPASSDSGTDGYYDKHLPTNPENRFLLFSFYFLLPKACQQTLQPDLLSGVGTSQEILFQTFSSTFMGNKDPKPTPQLKVLGK